MKIKIFGLGAIGSNLLVQLVRQFPDNEYEGIDFDKVEDRNIRTQAYFLEHIGQPKVNAIRAVCQRYTRKFKYTPVNTEIKSPPFKNHYPGQGRFKEELWVDCFDNSKSRKLLETVGEDYNILHLGFSPFYTAECIWAKDYDAPGDVDPAGNDICEMADAIGFINYFVNLSVMVISDFLENGNKSNFAVTSKIKVRRLG